MRPVPSRERTAERAVVASFGLATAAAVALMVTYWRGGQPQLEGLFIGLALGGIGVGLILWANALLAGTHVEHRTPLVASQEDTDALQRISGRAACCTAAPRSAAGCSWRVAHSGSPRSSPSGRWAPAPDARFCAQAGPQGRV